MNFPCGWVTGWGKGEGTPPPRLFKLYLYHILPFHSWTLLHRKFPGAGLFIPLQR
jgi:hypothetical protein